MTYLEFIQLIQEAASELETGFDDYQEPEEVDGFIEKEFDSVYTDR